MTNWEYIKSLTPKEAAQRNLFLCPYDRPDLGIEKLPCFDLEAQQQRFCTQEECEKCVEQWLKKEKEPDND